MRHKIHLEKFSSSHNECEEWPFLASFSPKKTKSEDDGAANDADDNDDVAEVDPSGGGNNDNKENEDEDDDEVQEVVDWLPWIRFVEVRSVSGSAFAVAVQNLSTTFDQRNLKRLKWFRRMSDLFI